MMRLKSILGSCARKTASGLSITTKLRTWVPSNLSKLLPFLFLLLNGGGSAFSYSGNYALVATAGPQTYLYNSDLSTIASYRSDTGQFTTYKNQNGHWVTHATYEKKLPPVWTFSPKSDFLFGVDPETHQIVKISLSNFQKSNINLKTPNARVYQFLGPNEYLIGPTGKSKYKSVSSYQTSSDVMKPLYRTKRQLMDVFYDHKSKQIASFEFEENSTYSHVLNQSYHLTRMAFFVIFNTGSKKVLGRSVGGYPTYNSLLREIIYFDEGQAMRYSFQSGRKFTLPIKVTPVYTSSGIWIGAPKIIRLPSGTFVLWGKQEDGSYELAQFSKDGTPIKILLAGQMGPVNLQLVQKPPLKFLYGDF